MTKDSQRIAVAEIAGWEFETSPTTSWSHNAPINGVYPTAYKRPSGEAWVRECRFYTFSEPMPVAYWKDVFRLVPNYPDDRNALYVAMEAAGLMDVANLALRVKWVNTLRNIVSKRCPVNHIGTPICSDVDLLLATIEELCEALLRTMDRWVEEPKTETPTNGE